MNPPKKYLYKGELLTIKDLSVIYDLCEHTIKTRLRRHYYKDGVDVESILGTPKFKHIKVK